MPTKIQIDTELLRHCYLEKKYSEKQLLEIFNISRSTLHRNLNAFNLKRPHSNIDSFLENILTEDFLFNEYVVKQKSMKTISDDLGISANSVHVYLKKYNLNRNYFEANKIQQYTKYNFDLLEKWTPDTAYILGFFAADGCMQKPTKWGGYCLSFGVGAKSLPVLEFMSEKIGGNINYYELYDRSYSKIKHSYVLTWNCHALYDYFKDVYKFNPRKSFNVDIPPNLPDELFVYFLRGNLDGDGCVFKSGNTYGFNFCSGSIKFLENVKNNLLKHNIKISGIYKLKTIYQITIYCSKAKLFGEYLYKDALDGYPQTFYLDYKYKKFLEF